MSSRRNLIILAEDNANQRESFIKAFQSMGYEVRAYDDGKPALEALSNLAPEDKARAILVTDWIMMGMDGPDLAENVRKTLPDIPIMMWTSGFTEDDKDTMIGSYLPRAHYARGKTIDTEAIAAAINATLEAFIQQQAVSTGGGKSPLDHIKDRTEPKESIHR